MYTNRVDAMGVWSNMLFENNDFSMCPKTQLPNVEYKTYFKENMLKWQTDAQRTCAKFQKLVAKFIKDIEDNEDATQGELDACESLKALL